jgi:predicted GTPase
LRARIHTNREAELHTSDKRWLENTIRRQWPFSFTATPLRVVLKAAPPRTRHRRRDKKRRG